jgi:hypothetical protein
MGRGRRFGRGDEQQGRGSRRVPGSLLGNHGPLGNQGLWLYRAVRGLRPDRNPLRRRTDRVETCLLAGLFVAAAAGAPFAAHAASQASYAEALRLQQEQTASRHQVGAALTQAATTVSGYALSTLVLTPATWMSAGGVRRSGEVPAEPDSPRGTVVQVWTDGNGYLVSPPLAASQVAGQADAAIVGTIAGIAVVYVAGAGAIRLVMNRRRMAAWDADWLATARTWNHQSW